MQKAYKRLALQCHPDKVGSDRELIDRFQAITTAYQVFSDPVATKAYWDMFRIRCFLFQTAHTPNAPLMPFYVFHVKKRDERGMQQAPRPVQRPRATVSLAYRTGHGSKPPQSR